MIKYYITFFVLLHSTLTISQQRYWIFFTDKSNTKFNPYEYFDTKAINRRQKLNISLFDSSDFPVNKNYSNKIEQIVKNKGTKSRWFNAIAVAATTDEIDSVRKLNFVKKINLIYIQTKIAVSYYDTVLNFSEKELLKNQLNRFGGNLFIKNKYTGKGIRIAVFDAGFPTVNTNPVFEHIRKRNGIIKTYDFARKKENVYAHNQHGTMVLSCIAGKIGNKQLGLAIDAEFLLARTEVKAEPFSEEENWLAAAEWADKNGADIINSSLGYTYVRYFTYQMDGKTSLVARAANLAAHKGILVINAMGNDGAVEWKILSTPADADSVISVGGINPYTNYHESFSSFGPSSDKRLKPNVVAFSEAIVSSKSGLIESSGTSFSTPLVAGFAACAWQTDTTMSNMQLFSKIQQSGDLYPYFDYAHGYGVPQASFFINQKKITKNKTFDFVKKNNIISIEIKTEFIDKKNKKKNNYLFYHIQNNEGYIDKYWLIDVYKNKAAQIDLRDFENSKKIVAHYKGYTQEYILAK